jgi:chromosome segregation ATPase
MSYDYIPPGKRVVGKRLVSAPDGANNPYEDIERLRAQVRVLEQRLNSNEINDLSKALQESKDRVAYLDKANKDLSAKGQELEAVVAEQRKTMTAQDNEIKILRGSERVKRGEAPPPLSPDMKEMAQLKEDLATANAKIQELLEKQDDPVSGKKGKKPS